MTANQSAYFVSTQTAGRKPLFRHERWARLMITTIEHYAERDYLLHAWVVMPDHLHVLLTPSESIEKAVQLIKGGFSFRAKKEFNWKDEVWQTGFTDHRIRDEEDWIQHLKYTKQNPVEAHLVDDHGLYPYMSFPNPEFPQGLKPGPSTETINVRAEARTLQHTHHGGGQ
jgi:putative transposase